jgi:hypothetical protein
MVPIAAIVAEYTPANPTIAKAIVAMAPKACIQPAFGLREFAFEFWDRRLSMLRANE